MQKITREAIRQLASSETVYYRGMRYYAAHAVSNVTWNETEKQYRAVVKGGNQYLVTINMDEEEITYTCNCPAHVKYHGACKHVVAVLLFISDYQQREIVKDTLDVKDRTAYKIIEYFQKREYRRMIPKLYHIYMNISIPSFLQGKKSRASVSFQAGNDKLYKIANIRKFIGDYYNEETIQLGKEFRYIPGECDFDESSKKILSYITELYEIQESIGKSYYANLFNRQEIVLTKEMLKKILFLAAGQTCHLSLYGDDSVAVEIVRGNPSVSMELTVSGEELQIGNSAEKRMLSLTNDGSILYYDGVIYLPDKDYICNLLPFYSAVFAKEDAKISFRGDNKKKFIEKVLPVIKKSMQVEVPKELKDSYVVETLEPQLYLDMELHRRKYCLTALVKFVYGSHAVNPLFDMPEEDVILVRDEEEEERHLKLLYDLGFKVSEDRFAIRSEDDLFRVLTENMHQLTEEFEVFYSKEYKKISIQKNGQISANVRINTDINLLEMDLKYSQIPKEELQEFFRAIRLKKKYYRLKKGSFIDLQGDSEQMHTLHWMLENGTVLEDGRMQFQKSTALYLEDMMPKGTRLNREESYKKLLEDMKHPGKTEYELPNNVQAKLRPYQMTGYRWLKNLAFYGMGGILADDMGLGKTLQAIVYICSNPESKTLIVCPTSLAYNWQEEFEKFAPGIRTCIVSGTPEERAELLKDSTNHYDVWITTYPLIRKDTESYEKLIFDNMFIDEAQFIKNPASLGAKAVKSIQAKHRFALTGTPIENALSELWSIFEFIMPGFFQKYRKFSEVYEKPILKEHNQQKMEELRCRIQPFILRRMKKDVLNDLPDKIETKRMAEMTKKQYKIYLSYLSRIQDEIKRGDSLETGQGRIQVLAALTRLRQICCHPGTFVEDYQGGSGKLDLLMEQLPDILEGDHSVLIFSQFTSMLSIIGEELDKSAIPYYYLSGSTKPAERKQYVKGFNQGIVKVFLISLKAGGTGLNLTGADTVIHFDPWWNPAVEDQATDRAYRIGQKKKVQVIRYVMKDSIEEKIVELQNRKKRLSDRVIESGEVFVNQLTNEELMELFAIEK